MAKSDREKSPEPLKGGTENRRRSLERLERRVSDVMAAISDGVSVLNPAKLYDPLKVMVNRPAYNQSGFDSSHDRNTDAKKGCCESISDCLAYEFSKERLWRGLKARFPCVEWMKNYNLKENIIGDIVAGITVGIMQIPLGMAYAQLANVPPVTGLYTSFFAVIIYSLLGTSHHISQGTFAVVSLMFAKTVAKLSGGVASTGGMNMVTTTANPLNQTSIFPGIWDLEEYDNTDPLGDILTSPPALAITTAAARNLTTVGAGGVLYDPIQVASAIGFLAGILQIAFGFLRLGALNVYLSDTLVSGFTTGAAVLVFSSQFDSVFGIKAPSYPWPFEIVNKFIYVFAHIADTNTTTVVVSVITIAILFVVAEWLNPWFQSKFPVPIPIELLAVVVGTGISYAMDFKGTYEVAIVGKINSGMPEPTVPPIIPLAKNIIGDAFAVAIVSYVISLALAKIFAKMHNYDLNANQEFIAMGASNVFASFFQCFPMCVAMSRTLVQVSVGGKTQLASIISCVVVLVVLLAIAPLFECLPNAVLSGIILVAIRRMFLQVRDLKKAWGISKLEAMTWLVTLLSVSLINIDVGLGIGVFFSILTVVWRSQTPYTSILGLVPDTGLYKDIRKYPKAKEEPGIKIYQFAAPVIFANSKTFRKEMYAQTGVNPRKVYKKMQKEKQREEAEKRKQMKKQDKEPEMVNNNGITENYEYQTADLHRPLESATLEKYRSNNTHINMGFDPDEEVMIIPEADKMEATPCGGEPIKPRRRSSLQLTSFMVNKVPPAIPEDAISDGTLPEASEAAPPSAGVHHIIVDFSAVSFVDSSGVTVLLQVIEEYKRISIAVYAAACSDPVIEMLESSNFYASAPPQTVYPTVNDAVAHAKYQYSLDQKTQR